VLSSGIANIRCHVEPAAAAKHLESDAHARQTLCCAQGDIGWEVEDGAFRQTQGGGASDSHRTVWEVHGVRPGVRPDRS
jgi:hypothetical protein